MRNERGMTLLELLVAMAVFVVLGSSLVVFLRVGIDTWRIGEIRRETFERGSAILDQLEDDLRSVHSDAAHGKKNLVDVLMVCDYDENDRQRLRFVRSLAGETRHPITRNAGTYSGAKMDLDFENDALEAERGLLRAPGGLQEVVYLSDPDPARELLWRGIRSPVGGERSILDPANLTVENGRVRHCRPFADGILHLQYRFWGGTTSAWVDGEGGMVAGWDSTRAIYDMGDGGYREESRHDPRDDVFPSRVQIVLVLRPARIQRFGKLTAAIDESDTELPLDLTQHYPEDAFPYVKLGDEWIRYESIRGRRLLGCERGVRGTTPTAHAVGTVAVFGQTFSRVVRIPAARDTTWSPR